MIEKAQNKMQTKENVKEDTDFLFPEHGITVKAKDKQEAEVKLKDIINKK